MRWPKGDSVSMTTMEQVLGQAWLRGGGAKSTKDAFDFLREVNKGLTHEQRLAQVRFLANLMDDRFAVPGTRIRFGFDSVLGLVPGLGDALTSAISLLIVHHAWQSGAPKLTLVRMLGNVGVDFVLGVVPVLGDLMDFAWRANRKNARLLEEHLTRMNAKGTVEIIPPARKPPRR
jgi:hypothetical protein